MLIGLPSFFPVAFLTASAAFVRSEIQPSFLTPPGTQVTKKSPLRLTRRP